MPPSKAHLHELASGLTRVHSEEQLLAEITYFARDRFQTEGVDIMIADGQHATLRASTIAPEYIGRLRISRDIGLGGLVFASGEVAVISKNLNKHRAYRLFLGYDEAAYESAVAQPIRDGDATLGVLTIRKRIGWKPTKSELNFIAELAVVAGNALTIFRNGARSATQSERRIEALTEAAEVLSRSPYIEEILQLLVNMTAQQFDFRVCTIRLLEEQTNELVLRATQATVRAYQRKRAIKLGESIAGRVIVEKQTVMVPDVQMEPDYIGHDLAVEQGLRSMICIPLLIQDRAVGVLTCYTAEVRDFGDEEILALETIAKQAAVSIEHAKLQVRSTLMQEMHHRVKNNLQQVVSLLRLQLRHAKYKNTEEAINDSLTRILAISSVHDLLSREDLDHVGIKSIAESLVGHQQQSFLPAEKKIEFEVRGEDIRLNMNQATQMALALNELIQNAVEHGFSTMNVGSIHINVESVETDVWIWVSNNGDPLPPGFEIAKSSSLGLQIVANLVKGLGGTFRVEDRLGWCVSEIRFSRSISE